VPNSAVLVFIDKNRDWIDKRLKESSQTRLIHDLDVLAPNTTVKFMEVPDVAEISAEEEGNVIIVSYPANKSWQDKDVQDATIKVLVPIWRKLAKGYLPGRLSQLAEAHGFEYEALRLKNIHTRWGSCTNTGNINLNIQLMKLDDDLIDHVLLHELSHTKALNHGKDFWKVFESVRPGARDERKQLKKMVIF